MKPTLNPNRLYGAVIGDIAGSTYEFSRNRDYNVPLFPSGADFTDDTILTIATADAIEEHYTFVDIYKHYARLYPNPTGSYGSSFSRWLCNYIPNNSKGNGCTMRVSPCAYATDNFNWILALTTESCTASHNHWQAVRFTHAVVQTIYMLNHGHSKQDVLEMLERDYSVVLPDLSTDFDTFRHNYCYTELVEGTAPEAIWCALSASSFEDAIRRAISLGGDADTLGAITGSIAECIHEIPKEMILQANKILDKQIIGAIASFNKNVVWKRDFSKKL